ncbi:MAG: hypothetical protein ACT4TC_09880 [Myxococcaceae bacterium]
MTRSWPLLVSLLVAAGCSGPTPAVPVKVMAVVRSADGAYKAQPVELATLTDATAMQGDVADFQGGARIVVDENDPLFDQGPLTDAQLASVLLKNPGSSPRASYVEKSGVLWPVDFHTWSMVSTYWNFEKAFNYFKGTGVVDMEALSGRNASKVYYFADITFTDRSPKPQRDNAYFYSVIQGFVLAPFDSLQRLPLSMNMGVIAHEYAHRVFNLRVYKGAALPRYVSDWDGTATPQINLLKAMDEGFADYHAFAASCVSPGGCDTKLFSASLPQSSPEASARDVGLSHCMTDGLRNSLNTKKLSDFTAAQQEYQVGTLFATALYEAGLPGNKHSVVGQALLAAYSDTSQFTLGFAQLAENNLITQENFTLEAVLNAILTQVTNPDVRTALCDAFQDRLQAVKVDMPACPANAVAMNRKCPVLNP